MAKLTALHIPCPSNTGLDDETPTLRYRLWFSLYWRTRQIPHWFGVHDKPLAFSIAPRCDWCGHRSPEQQQIASANWDAMHGGGQA